MHRPRAGEVGALDLHRDAHVRRRLDVGQGRVEDEGAHAGLAHQAAGGVVRVAAYTAVAQHDVAHLVGEEAFARRVSGAGALAPRDDRRAGGKGASLDVRAAVAAGWPVCNRTGARSVPRRRSKRSRRPAGSGTPGWAGALPIRPSAAVRPGRWRYGGSGLPLPRLVGRRTKASGRLRRQGSRALPAPMCPPGFQRVVCRCFFGRMGGARRANWRLYRASAQPRRGLPAWLTSSRLHQRSADQGGHEGA